MSSKYACLLLQGWDMDEEAPPADRDAKFSWEVIRDNSVFTYRIDLVPGYSEIMGALKASCPLLLRAITNLQPQTPRSINI